MSYVFSTSVAITTSTAGAATVYTGPLTGLISSIKYAPTDTASTADIVVTTNTNAMPVVTKANFSKSAATFLFPRSVAHTVAAGAASGISTELIPIVKEKLKCVMASGGNAKTGTLTVFIQ